MTKRTVLLGIFMLIGAISTGQAAEDGQWDLIQGKVSFQRRQTIVPMALCQGSEACPRSKPFWTILIEGRSGRFELDEVFELGKETPPTQLEVFGLPLHEGSQVIIQGKVDPISEDFGIVSEIKSLEVVADIGSY